MDKELEQFFQPWELKLLEMIEEVNKKNGQETSNEKNGQNE